MLHIRLSRKGKKKQPIYRVIVCEKHKDPWGDYLENLGNYNPRTKEIELKADRIKHWIDKGAQASDTVWNLLVEKGIVEGKKRTSSKISKKRLAKAEEGKKEAEDKKAVDEATKEDGEEPKEEGAEKEEVKEEKKEEPKEEEPKEEKKEDAPKDEEKKEDKSEEPKEDTKEENQPTAEKEDKPEEVKEEEKK